MADTKIMDLTDGSPLVAGDEVCVNRAGTDRRVTLIETGTWTPGISFGGGTSGITYSSQVGSYMRIGNRCFVSGRVTMSAKGSSTGTAAITGLPFANVNTSDQIAAFALRVGSLVSISGAVQGITAPNVTTITLSTSTTGALVGVSDANFSATTSIVIGGHYLTV